MINFSQPLQSKLKFEVIGLWNDELILSITPLDSVR